MLNDELRARAQLSQDRYYKEVARYDAHGLEGLKAFLTLNAGGCVAMLGFMQALISKGVAFTVFKPYGSAALCCFAVGVVFSALIPISRMLDTRNTIQDLLRKGEGHNGWTHTTTLLWSLGGTAFLTGIVAVGLGIANLEIKDSPNSSNVSVTSPSSQAAY